MTKNYHKVWKQLLGNAEPWPFLGRDNPSFYLIGEVIPPRGGRTYGHLCPQGNRKAQVHLSRQSLFEWSFWFRFLILVKTQFTGFSSSVRRPERLGRWSRGSPQEPRAREGTIPSSVGRRTSFLVVTTQQTRRPPSTIHISTHSLS